MSGYGGQSPSGWQDPYDPYGQQQQPPPSGWQDPYGHGYGYGPPGVPVNSASNGSAIGALVCNIVLTLTCCGLLAIPGIVMSAIAMGRVTTDPDSARSLTMWSWIIFAVNVVIVVVIGIVYVALIAKSSSYQSTTY